MAQILTLQALRDCFSARFPPQSVQACPHQAPASSLPMGSSILSSAKAGKLEMIMMPAVA
jgi:hypothetical protein